MKILNEGLILLLSVAIILSACAPSPRADLAQSKLNREIHPSVLEGDVDSLVRGNNSFALDLYKYLLGENGNLIYSPYSISLALAMTYAGARGNTESQMADVLHFEFGQNTTHPAFNALDLGLSQRGESTDEEQQPLKLRIANAIWAERTFTFSQAYLDTISSNYGAGIHLADFINQFEPARKEINTWVEDQTEDRIKDLLAEGTLNPATRLVLVNAIYFKADWLSQFSKESTFNETFHLLDGSVLETPSMHQGMYIPYARGDGWQAVELPYAGETAAMTIIVPDEGDFAMFESVFDFAKYETILGSLQPASVMLALPKFTFTRDFALADILTGMGMPDAFNPDIADFSGMTGKPELFIDNVIHKAFVAVDEEGTEAAAATAVIMRAVSEPNYDVTLTIDRPFIFVIRDTVSGQILFMGRVVNPTLQ